MEEKVSWPHKKGWPELPAEGGGSDKDGKGGEMCQRCEGGEGY